MEVSLEAGFIKGVIPALVTPMNADESLSRDGMKTLIDGVIEQGVHGVFTCGTAGEFWAMTLEEKRQVFEWTVAFTDGRVPVYVGTSANSTTEAVTLAKFAEAAGAQCLSVLTPAFITPDDDEMFRHYAEIAEATVLPILLYNLPARTGNTLTLSLVDRLHRRFPNIVGIKDSSGNFEQALTFMRELPDGFRMIMGRDTLIYSALLEGAAGAIAASANVAPDIAAGIYDAFVEGEHDLAKELQARLVPLRDAFALGTHPAMLKAGADLVGLAGGPPRRPVSPLNDDQMATLRQILKTVGKSTVR
jgi:4-hydroxy-tetrahydrodipicolinate synthase